MAKRRRANLYKLRIMSYLTDKELLRQHRYVEALGDNYNGKPIYVMLFEGTRKYINVPTIHEKGYTYNEQVYVADNHPTGDWFGHCIDHLRDINGKDINFYSTGDAKKWIKKNTKPLPENQWWCYGNHNADWL